MWSSTGLILHMLLDQWLILYMLLDQWLILHMLLDQRLILHIKCETKKKKNGAKTSTRRQRSRLKKALCRNFNSLPTATSRNNYGWMGARRIMGRAKQLLFCLLFSIVPRAPFYLVFNCLASALYIDRGKWMFKRTLEFVEYSIIYRI